MKHPSILAIVVITFTLVAALPEAVYMIHYVRSYRSDQGHLPPDPFHLKQATILFALKIIDILQ